MNDTELAKIAYQGYGEATGFKTFDGRPMPEWAALGEKIQLAWTAAAAAVVDQLAAMDDAGITASD